MDLWVYGYMNLCVYGFMDILIYDLSVFGFMEL